MANLTPPALPHPRPPTMDCAPEVSISETQSPGLAPISGAFRPNPVDSVSLASPALKSTDPYPQPRQLTPGPSIAGPKGLLASHLPAAHRLRFADSNHLRVDTPHAAALRTTPGPAHPRLNARAIYTAIWSRVSVYSGW